MTVVCVSFVWFLIVDHIPMCNNAYLEDEKNGRVYQEFWTGLESTMMDRIKSQSWDHWKTEWQWMAAYFVPGVWSALFMATGPRAHIKPKPVSSSKVAPTEATKKESKKNK